MNAVLYSLWPAWTGGWRAETIAFATGGSMLMIGLAVATAATAYGLWVVEPWAWVLSLLLYGLSIPVNIAQSEAVPVVLAIGALLYLCAIADFYGFEVG